MSGIRPQFLSVLRDDAERVGFLEAGLLALVRYVTGLPGEHNGRVEIDGEMYWQASHAEIGEALGGLHRKKVERMMRKLEAAGELWSCSPDSFNGDQTKAYHIPSDQQWSDLTRCTVEDTDTGSKMTRTGTPVTRTWTPVSRYLDKIDHSSSPTEELSEEAEEIDDRASQAIARRDHEIHAQALDITNTWVHGMNRKGSAKTIIVTSVEAALRHGLDEDAIVAVIRRWQKELYPRSHALSRMLAQARSYTFNGEPVGEQVPERGQR
jgi:hypothetical protein